MGKRYHAKSKRNTGCSKTISSSEQINSSAKSASSTSVTSERNDVLNLQLKLPSELIQSLDQNALDVIAQGTMEFLHTILKNSAEQLPAPYYDTERGCYYISDQTLHEDDVFWIPLEAIPSDSSECQSANVDEMMHVPIAFNVQHVPKYLEEAYLKARFLAFGQDTPGTPLICHAGGFYIPAVEFVNPYTNEREFLMSIFNASFCLDSHRHCYTAIDAEIGNLGFGSFIRYVQGAELDWHKRFWDEVALIRRSAIDYDPFSDPYDQKNMDSSDGFQFYGLFE